MNKIKKMILYIAILIYLFFLTITLARSILSIEITNTFFNFYQTLLRFINLGIELILILFVCKYVIVEKIHQKIKEKNKSIS